MGRIKLDKRDVKNIRMLMKHTTLTDKEIAIMYNVSRRHINAIRKGQRWNYEY